jgi:hypothetical protein
VLKTPVRDGTAHVIFEPCDFIARLAALLPRLRGATRAALEATGKLEVERHCALRWAARPKRVFAIEIDAFPFTCLQHGV